MYEKILLQNNMLYDKSKKIIIQNIHLFKTMFILV